MSNDQQTKRSLQIALVGLFLGAWLLAWYMERINLRVNPPAYLATYLPPELANGLVLLVLELLSPRVWRHLIPFGLGFYLAYQATLSLVKDLFDLPTAEAAQSFLQRYALPDTPAGAPLKIERLTFHKDRLQQPLLRYGGPGKITVTQGDVVVTERNGRFQRVLGRGEHLLAQYEYVRFVLDARPQDRASFGVRFYTRDGIELRTDVSLTFCLGRGGQETTPETPYPFDPPQVRRAAYTEYLVTDGHTEGWMALPMHTTIRLLRQLASKKSLDDLFYRDNPHMNPHELLGKRLKELAAQALAEKGIDLLDVRLGRLDAPDAVVQQRLAYWRAHWQSNQRLLAGEGQAQAHEAVEQARTEAKVAAIRRILQELQTHPSGPAEPHQTPQDVLAVRLLNVLGQMSSKAKASREASQIARLRDQILLLPKGDEGEGREGQK